MPVYCDSCRHFPPGAIVARCALLDIETVWLREDCPLHEERERERDAAAYWTTCACGTMHEASGVCPSCQAKRIVQ